MKLNRLFRLVGGGVAAIVGLEIGLRVAFGLGTPPLSQADPQTGYRFQPNQKLVRFGKHIEYNEYSQRNGPIAATKPANVRRIMMVGDSVINGGATIDQSQILTAQLRDRLIKSGYDVEVINASAGSWGVENRIGYVKEFGTFASDVLILQIGTSDLIQPTSTGDVVGYHPSYPDHSPPLALSEAWLVYMQPRLSQLLPGANVPAKNEASPAVDEGRWFQRNMQSLQKFLEQMKAQKMPVLVLFTPDRKDVIPTPGKPRYKTEFFHLLNTLKTPVIDVHAAWVEQPKTTIEGYFWDGVHLTPQGNAAVVELLRQQPCLSQALPNCASMTIYVSNSAQPIKQ